jgi:hypothetical protein
LAVCVGSATHGPASTRQPKGRSRVGLASPRPGGPSTHATQPARRSINQRAGGARSTQHTPREQVHHRGLSTARFERSPEQSKGTYPLDVMRGRPPCLPCPPPVGLPRSWPGLPARLLGLRCRELLARRLSPSLGAPGSRSPRPGSAIVPREGVSSSSCAREDELPYCKRDRKRGVHVASARKKSRSPSLPARSLQRACGGLLAGPSQRQQSRISHPSRPAARSPPRHTPHAHPPCTPPLPPASPQARPRCPARRRSPSPSASAQPCCRRSPLAAWLLPGRSSSFRWADGQRLARTARGPRPGPAARGCRPPSLCRP